jgi:hypothetical protein
MPSAPTQQPWAKVDPPSPFGVLDPDRAVGGELDDTLLALLQGQRPPDRAIELK